MIDGLGLGRNTRAALMTGREYYMNIAIAWALISFVGTLALAKYLEGRPYDA